MKRYRVIFTEEAKQDIRNSLRWGVDRWGTDMALRWFRDIKSHTRKILSVFPFGQPLAPKSDELGREIRHLIFGRYRVLFEVSGKTVTVIHVIGSYVDPEHEDMSIED